MVLYRKKILIAVVLTEHNRVNKISTQANIGVQGSVWIIENPKCTPLHTSIKNQ